MGRARHYINGRAVNLFVRCHPPILLPSHFFRMTSLPLRLKGERKGSTSLPTFLQTHSLLCVQPAHSPPVRHFPTCQLIFKSLLLIVIEVFDYQISDSTITCQPAQCQRRKLPPHPNPPRNPPARQDSSNQKFDFFDQKKSKVRVSRVSVSEASYGLGSEYKRSNLRKPIHHSRQTNQTQKISRFSLNNIHSRQIFIFYINCILITVVAFK